MNIIEAINLKKSFNKTTQALRGASLAVKEGEVVAIMGQSGSGKSTLLHCLAGILKIDSGEVIFEQENIGKMSDRRRNQLRREKFGFVFQFSQLVPELTALDNVALPLLIRGVKKSEAYKEAKKWVKKVGLETSENKIPGELSGGQAQRIAIARAMVNQPKILFADEPTGSLDSANSEKVMDLFIKTVKENNTTVIMVTHEASIAAYADRIITVKDGIVEDKAPSLTTSKTQADQPKASKSSKTNQDKKEK